MNLIAKSNVKGVFQSKMESIEFKRNNDKYKGKGEKKYRLHQ